MEWQKDENRSGDELEKVGRLSGEEEWADESDPDEGYAEKACEEHENLETSEEAQRVPGQLQRVGEDVVGSALASGGFEDGVGGPVVEGIAGKVDDQHNGEC